ncbi:uncharacterized protein LOC132760437 [Ruditapes philippinarum]|uniref:uncharacterized protein LOC132760437 n=1 Tax=Ruditapes philippinarum TaxID=129788 RepID=UPI00295BC5E5|nr:uncharacterized protein LOC132760437 [Ruditapes philippinarum]
MVNRPSRNVAPVPVQHTGMAVISQGYQPPYNQQQPPPYNQQQPPYNQQQPPYNQQQPLQPSASNGQFSTPYGYGGQQSSSVEKPEKFDSAVPPVATYRNP